MSHSSTIDGLISVSELTGRYFFIPSYQRGFRWGTDQVKALLDDIRSYQQRPTGDFYCLQPLVVKMGRAVRDEGEVVEWEVIDGQQRLTTILLILSHLEAKTNFHLHYETREHSEDFLNSTKTLDTEKAKTNVDFHHIEAAYLAIEEWFKGWEQNARGPRKFFSVKGSDRWLGS